MSYGLGKYIVVSNALPKQTVRLLGREDPEWMPSTTEDLVQNKWLALALDTGDRLTVIGAVSWLKNTAENYCFITGLCTDASYRRKGVGRMLLLKLLRANPRREIVIDLPRAKSAACAFFEHYGFKKQDGSFVCDGGGSVEYSYYPQSQKAPKPLSPGGHAHVPKRPS